MSQDLIERMNEFKASFNQLQSNVEAALSRCEAAGQYEDFVRSATDWVWETDANLNFTFISDGIAQAFGVPAQALAGSYMFALNRFRRVEGALIGLVERIEDHRPFRNVAVPLTAKDGTPRIILLSGVPVFEDDSGRFAGYRGTGVDPDRAPNRPLRTAAPETAAEVKAIDADKAGDFCRRAVDAAGIGAWEWDIEENRFHMSPALRAALGYTVCELGGTIEAWYDCIHPDDRERVKAEIARHLADESPRVDIEHRMTGGDGRILWVVSRGLAERDGAGAALRLPGASTDVTGRMEAEETLRTARHDAESASRAKTAFLAHLSHELRTPLNAIIGFSEAIKDNVFGALTAEKAQDYAGDIHAAGYHLLQLIDDILDLSRIEAGEMELEETAVDLEQVLNASVRLIDGQATRKGLSLNVAFGADLPHVRADKRVIKQVMVNLLSNAVKYTPPGGVVSLRAVRRGDGGLRMEVSDTGVGIADEDIPKVLTPFGRVTGDLAVTPDGVGLGLPLSKSLVELHGGSLELRSSKGCGTDAVVDLPAERTLADPAPAA